MLLWQKITAWLHTLLGKEKDQAVPEIDWQQAWSDFLQQQVVFYRALSNEDKKLFEQRTILFLQTTRVEARSDSSFDDVTDEDKLLVAASAIIPVWNFPQWHYFNLQSVILLPSSFNDDFECAQPNSNIQGMVGTGLMSGKMVLSRQALHTGFSNSQDKHNVGIHEFAHLIDMADGTTDGFPERLYDYQFSIPWLKLVQTKIQQINHSKSNIRDYAATNDAEFFAVASEYFFERPKMLNKKHPKLYQSLSDFYQQDIIDINNHIKPKRRAKCPCGSGKRYKNCCMPKD